MEEEGGGGGDVRVTVATASAGSPVDPRPHSLGPDRPRALVDLGGEGWGGVGRGVQVSQVKVGVWGRVKRCCWVGFGGLVSFGAEPPETAGVPRLYRSFIFILFRCSATVRQRAFHVLHVLHDL